MNFFKSILSDDPDPPKLGKPHESGPKSSPNGSQGTDDDESDGADANSSSRTNTSAAASVGGGWNWGGLIKTFANRSESMLETYRRDLQEFGSGLKKETDLFREVASRAVKELPASIEVGASVAHGSLESVSHAIDGVIKSTAGIISHGKEIASFAPSDVDSDTPDAVKLSGSGRYSRFDAQMGAIQNDENTFSEEPEDLEDFRSWKSGFILEEKAEEIEILIGGNGVLEGAYRKLVPNVVDDETFWCRYFYRVHKLKQQECVRANLVKRVIATDDEEELTWDVDDDEEGDENDADNLQGKNAKSNGDELGKRESSAPSSSGAVKQESPTDEPQNSSTLCAIKVGESKSDIDQLSETSVNEEKAKDEVNSEAKNEEKREGEKLGLDAKGDQGESGKESDISVVSSLQSALEEHDLEWDEIEDIGSGDEKKVTAIAHGGSPAKDDVRKRLSTPEEDEELTWDIEDDD